MSSFGWSAQWGVYKVEGVIPKVTNPLFIIWAQRGGIILGKKKLPRYIGRTIPPFFSLLQLQGVCTLAFFWVCVQGSQFQ